MLIKRLHGQLWRRLRTLNMGVSRSLKAILLRFLIMFAHNQQTKEDGEIRSLRTDSFYHCLLLSVTHINTIFGCCCYQMRSLFCLVVLGLTFTQHGYIQRKKLTAVSCTSNFVLTSTRFIENVMSEMLLFT